MNKSSMLLMSVFVLLLASCAGPTPEIVVVTATPEPTDPAPTATAMPIPTEMPTATPTLEPRQILAERGWISMGILTDTVEAFTSDEPGVMLLLDEVEGSFGVDLNVSSVSDEAIAKSRNTLLLMGVPMEAINEGSRLLIDLANEELVGETKASEVKDWAVGASYYQDGSDFHAMMLYYYLP